METTYKYRVLYADTDAMGVVYYGNYLRIYEAARGDYLQKIGLPFSKMASEMKILCPVVSATINYHKPAFLDQDINVTTEVVLHGDMRISFVQRIFDCNGVLLNDIRVLVAFVDSESRRPVKYPEQFCKVGRLE